MKLNLENSLVNQKKINSKIKKLVRIEQFMVSHNPSGF